MSEIRFATQLKAIDHKTGELSTWRGQDIYTDTLKEAQEWVDNNAGYLEIIGYYNDNGEIVYFEKAIAA